jgi:hypothetical protein
MVKKTIKKKKKGMKKAEEDLLKLVKSKNFIAGVIIVLVLILLVVGYSIVQNLVSSESEGVEEGEEVVLHANAFSEEAFDYINEFRVANELPALDFSYDVYLVALDMADKKEVDSSMFRQVPERNEFVEVAIGLSEASVHYTSIYSIEGQGIEGFKEEFNRIYFIKNIIKLEKYGGGAIGCNENYCSLILLGDEEIELRKDF